MIKSYSTHQLHSLPTLVLIPYSVSEIYLCVFKNVFKHQSFYIFTRVSKASSIKLPEAALRYIIVLDLVDTLVFLLGIDSSSTTSSASPLPNSYDALEGGGYPGNLFCACLMVA